MKLWSKDQTVTAATVEKFTVGRDKEFDVLLAPFDIAGSKAHAQMLKQTGLISEMENDLIQEGLSDILLTVTQPGFSLPAEVEDIHSFVELKLTDAIGEAGKKLHTARSRNDQVAVDIKLFLRSRLKVLAKKVDAVFKILITQAESNKHRLLPGYTHLQLAMPSSAGLWLSAYAESLSDDLVMLGAAYKIVNSNPLGSGAGYGSSFPINRSSTTNLLGFEYLHFNSVYAQMSRGKTERVVASAISFLAATLGRLSYDCCLYVNQNFDFIYFPDELTTGSSIMPHKKNPDVFELIRAKCNQIQSVPNELTLLVNNLPSGYHRDLQLTKESLFPALQNLEDCFDMMSLMMQNLQVRDGVLDQEKYKYLFTVEAMNELVNQGMSYRDAYRKVGNSVANNTFQYQPGAMKHTHEGSIGNLCLQQITDLFQTRLQPILA